MRGQQPICANCYWDFGIYWLLFGTPVSLLVASRLPGKNIRIALLPKSSGGFRPLAIASVMWRLCMSAVLKKLRGWIDSWALPQLCGGLPGKSIMNVHEWLAEDISLAKQRRQDLVGCKADIRKCFDSVCPRAALCVWKWLGAPTELCQLLENFYDNQQRWFAWQGCFFSTPDCVSSRPSPGLPG